MIDPIDGTKNFVRGVPVWATLIGLMDGKRTVQQIWEAGRARLAEEAPTQDEMIRLRLPAFPRPRTT